MKKILTHYGAYVLAVALMMPLAQAQPTKIQAAFGDDAGTLSKKFTGLARVMAGKYDWKPGQGVRSVSDVFNLIVEENGLLADALSGTPNKGAEPAPITDPGKMQDALKASYANLQKAITGLSNNDLATHVKLFGEDAGTLSKKFTGLAQVMAGKYEWKPGQGVRSVGDVFNLIVQENGLLADALTGKTNAGTEPAPITDPGKMQDALKASYANLQKADRKSVV